MGKYTFDITNADERRFTRELMDFIESGGAPTAPQNVPVAAAPEAPPASAPPAPPASAASGTRWDANALDAAGMPWDPEIHAASRTKLQKHNTWKLKPKPREYADKSAWEAYVETVRAEHRAAGFGAPAVEAAATNAPPAPTNAPPAPGLPDASTLDFASFWAQTQAMGKTQEEINAALAAFQIAGIHEIGPGAAHEGKIPEIARYLQVAV